MQFAITGNPVTHSLSPQLFSAAYGGRYSYGLLPAQSAEEAVKLFNEQGLQGMNVTAPFKTDMLALVDELSEEVKKIGALNTVVRLPNGRLKAYNTDYLGVVGSLEEFGISTENKICLVLGAGGAGMAAAYALKQTGGNVYLLNRTLEKAEQAAATLGVFARSLNDFSELVSSATIIVNTLPPSVGFTSSDLLKKNQVVMDASYQGSTFLEEAEQAGCTCIDGRYWLLHQAISGYKLFTGIAPNIEAMRRTLKLNE